eukprot:834165-Rhodomonas_salina.2
MADAGVVCGCGSRGIWRRLAVHHRALHRGAASLRSGEGCVGARGSGWPVVAHLHGECGRLGVCASESVSEKLLAEIKGKRPRSWYRLY